ncbi:MAG TPA: HTH domain-containing protein [Pseudonocardiaceae bacterium]
MAAFVKVPRGLSVSLRCTSTSALAERCGVSSRTIERDLRSLQDAGVPLYATAGRRGGYAPRAPRGARSLQQALFPYA